MSRTPLHVTVTPQPPSGKEIRCAITGPENYVRSNTIWLDASESYDITFTLAGAGGVNDWDGTPFASKQDGYCPEKGDNTTGIFKVSSAGPGGKSIVVSVDAQADASCNLYRLNFNDSYTCDPIIIIT